MSGQSSDITAIGMAAALKATEDLTARGYDAKADEMDVVVCHNGLTYRLHSTIVNTGTNTREQLHEAFARAVAQRLIGEG